MKLIQARSVLLLSFAILLFSCNQESATFHFKNGLAKYNLEDFYGAIKDLDKAINLKNDHTEAYYCRAICYINTDDPDKAITDFDKVIELDPAYEDAYLNRAFYIKDKKGDYKGSIEDYNKYIKLNKKGDNSYALNNRGFAKYKLGELSEALEDIDQSIILNPQNSFAFKNKALVLLAMDSLDLACESLQKSNDLGFTTKFGNEVEDLINQYCRD